MTAPEPPDAASDHGSRPRSHLLLLATAIALLLLAGLGSHAASASRRTVPTATRGVVDHIADGDTFTLRNGQRVRIIGIDTPEEYFGKHDCGSKPAAALLGRLLPAGMPVTLRRDSIQPSRDRYGRLLRYVTTTRIPDIGLAMIRSGWAGAYPYGSGNTREDHYRLAARTARSRHRGGWATCHPLPPAYTHAGG